MRIAAFVAAAAALVGAAKAGEATPLFSSRDQISIAISAPWRDLARASPESPPVPGTLTIGDETLSVLIGTRGKSRRAKNVCDFPPLRIEFDGKPPATSLFHKQEKLKLVTYCRRAKNHQQLVLKEYAAYRLYNVATEESFRARLAAISYVDALSGKTDIARTGFFIEDVDDLARRVDRKEVERGATPLAMYDRSAAARAALFHYMIGNLDWALTEGPEGEDCCHNGKIIGDEKTSETGLSPAPYDFDMSGFVDAPYALPPAQFKIKSVTTRVYRGFCAHNEETRAAAAAFRGAREAFLAAVAETPGLSEASVKKTTKFLDGFFKAIGDDAAVEKNLIEECRR